MGDIWGMLYPNGRDEDEDLTPDDFEFEDEEDSEN